MEKGKRISTLRHIGIKKTKLISSRKSSVDKAKTINQINDSEEPALGIEKDV